MATCRECNWWHPLSGNVTANADQKGRCHGRAPTATVISMPNINQIAQTVTPQFLELTAWPQVGAGCEECGDFKARNGQ